MNYTFLMFLSFLFCKYNQFCKLNQIWQNNYRYLPNWRKFSNNLTSPLFLKHHFWAFFSLQTPAYLKNPA